MKENNFKFEVFIWGGEGGGGGIILGSPCGGQGVLIVFKI